MFFSYLGSESKVREREREKENEREGIPIAGYLVSVTCVGYCLIKLLLKNLNFFSLMLLFILSCC